MRKGSTRSVVAVLVSALALGATPTAVQAGPPSRTDLDFVRRVHLTVLSVSPASARAGEVSAHAAVKNLAAQITTQNAQLDDLARTTASALAVPLTDPLPAAQQAALATLQGHTGAVFETDYVNYLWTADSTLLPISMTVHGTTENAAVRKLAEKADSVVAAQLPLLQNSGLLQMTVLPTPATATVARLPGGVPHDQGLEAQARAGDGFLSPTLRVRLFVLVAALAAAGALTWRVLTRTASPGRRRTRPARTRHRT